MYDAYRWPQKAINVVNYIKEKSMLTDEMKPGTKTSSVIYWPLWSVPDIFVVFYCKIRPQGRGASRKFYLNVFLLTKHIKISKIFRVAGRY